MSKNEKWLRADNKWRMSNKRTKLQGHTYTYTIRIQLEKAEAKKTFQRKWIGNTIFYFRIFLASSNTRFNTSLCTICTYLCTDYQLSIYSRLGRYACLKEVSKNLNFARKPEKELNVRTKRDPLSKCMYIFMFLCNCV